MTTTATCPVCGTTDCKVREVFVQATRSEPRRSLGLEAICTSTAHGVCALSFKVEATR